MSGPPACDGFPGAERAGPWTLRTWGTRAWITAECTRCGAGPWDEPLGMLATFDDIPAAREELTRDWGWRLSATPGGQDIALCPRCAEGTRAAAPPPRP